MIPPSVAPLQQQNWQQCLRDAVTSPRELLDILALPANLLDDIEAVCRDFPLRVPRPYLDNIEKGNPYDPLLRQILPLTEERLTTPGFSLDPLEEIPANACRGLIHKYPNRALLITTSACAIHCRYCFRRHFPYTENSNSRAQWQQAMDYLSNHKEINEAILSGGDPLNLSDKHLEWLISSIAEIPHIKHIRIHTRLPVVIPQRITEDLISTLKSTDKNCIMVVHCNHGNELSRAVITGLKTLKDNGITLLNQSVLLAGINDHADTLAALGEKLFSAGVLPYYLHLPDKVQGTAHFDISEAQALSIYRELQAKVSGFLLPRLVREIPGQTSKTLVHEPVSGD
ncbi:MAG: EF-P beta-lysylation protein EpmB [Pseudomonadales bacterium]|nr:EF-P beta-lysylation protein EpmB [Pseudomonadales bacterium]